MNRVLSMSVAALLLAAALFAALEAWVEFHAQEIPREVAGSYPK